MSHEIFLATDYGAIGDGKTDNTIIFKKIIQLIQTNGDGQLLY